MGENDDKQSNLLSAASDLDLTALLIADLHDDLMGKITRFRHLADLSAALGSEGTMMPGGQVVYAAWSEARTSYIHGNYVATVLLCQGLAEHMLAAQLDLALGGEKLPERVAFQHTLQRCLDCRLLTSKDAKDLHRLMELRNPLSHYRSIDDPSNLTQRSMNSGIHADDHLRGDASFAISMAIRLLALPSFRLGK